LAVLASADTPKDVVAIMGWFYEDLETISVDPLISPLEFPYLGQKQYFLALSAPRLRNESVSKTTLRVPNLRALLLASKLSYSSMNNSYRFLLMRKGQAMVELF